MNARGTRSNGSDSGIQPIKNETNLKEARKRLIAIQGPAISFKRPRQASTLQSELSGISSNQYTSSCNTSSVSRNTPSGTSAAKKPNNPISSPYGRCSNVSERFQKVARIGEGTYGIVYKAIDLENQQVVALKRCLPHHQESDGFPVTTLREIQILREISLDANQHEAVGTSSSTNTSTTERENGTDNETLNTTIKTTTKTKTTATQRESQGHAWENIVSLKEVAVGSKSSSVFLVFEYLHFDLAKLIDEHYAKYSTSPFTLPETKCLTRQLFSAIRYIHKKCIIHRDLKLSNLLYDKDRGLLKLADFGLARKMNGNRTTTATRIDTRTRRQGLPRFPSTPEPMLTPKVVSLWYRPPELLLNTESYTMAIDLWAAGCVVAEFLLGKPLFRGKNDLDQLTKIVDVLGPPFVDIWPGLLDMPLVKNGSIELPFSLAMQNDPKRISLTGTGAGSGNGTGAGNAICKGLMDQFSNLSSSGIEVLTSLLKYDPDRRWTAEDAFNCSWLNEYPHPTNPAFMPKFENKL